MIVAAHVGVGLCGKEGAQAARSGAFALAEFRLRGSEPENPTESDRDLFAFATRKDRKGNYMKLRYTLIPNAKVFYSLNFNGKNTYESDRKVETLWMAPERPRLLRRAVFGHGREAYRRNSMVCLYTFYKHLS
jgi:magnesium-transporting ATPase (P-type)